ncbi:sensor histidine kinase [Caballeronia sp. LjRoot31]|uniref:sensor histidine kinase n=1 Tax=Caballeronia sp. LjRoot31 TaxID=3342324 RepID=UPI003F4FF38A
MAGGQRRQSLSLQLSAGIGAVIVAVGIVACGLSFAFAFQEARALQDGQLSQIAALIDNRTLTFSGSQASLRSPLDADVRVVISRLTEGSSRVVPTATPAVDPKLADGFHDFRSEERDWRVNIRTLQTGARIAVAEPSTLRDEIARDGAMRTLVPVLLLLPVLMLVVMVIVRSKLSPLTRLATVVDQQTHASLEPLPDANIAKEILPFVNSINSLIERLRDAIGHQRRFVASAAHELRSPLAALSLQAGNLESTITSPDARQRLLAFQSGLRRTHRLVEQLLALARSEQGALEQPTVASPRGLVTDAINANISLARAKDIDLGVERIDDADIVIEITSVSVVLRNLIDNAVRYTPTGGKVDVSVIRSGADVTFEIVDSGPGIPNDQLKRVLEPFYRLNAFGTSGSGLGLCIVSEIARRSGGQLILENIDGGFRARYFQPLRSSP